MARAGIELNGVRYRWPSRPDLLRSRTIMAEFSRHGARVVSITAKDKLRRQLGKDMDLAGGSVNFSSECAEQCTLEEHGIENVHEFVGMPLNSSTFSMPCS